MGVDRIIPTNESKREVVIMNCCVCMDSIVCMDASTDVNMLSSMNKYSIVCSFMSTTCRRCRVKIECRSEATIGDATAIGAMLVFSCPTYKKFSKLFGRYPALTGGNVHMIVQTDVAMNMIPSTYTVRTTMADEEGNVILKVYESGDFF